jgi:2'-5' RNA ligase
MADGDETAEGTFLWLAPAEPEAAAIRGLIGELSCRLGTEPFDPHVTLLGPAGPAGEELVRHLRTLAARPALRLPLAGVRGDRTFFRALYAAVEPTPALRALHEEARASIPAPQGPYLPHLSLAYGRLDAAQVDALSRELAPRLPPEITVAHLDAVRTDGPVRAWRREHRFDLAPASR